MKTHELKSSGLDKKKLALKKLPFADEMDKTAQVLATNAAEALESGKMGGVEAAGHISLATILAAVSSGDIPLKQVYPLLKGIAEKKTPAPVQKIETRQEVDMRAVLVEAVASNPSALEKVVAISLAAREKVRIQIGALDNKLELKPLPKATKPESDSDDVTEMPADDLAEFAYDLREPKSDIGNLVAPPKVNAGWKPGEPPPELGKLQEQRR